VPDRPLLASAEPAAATRRRRPETRPPAPVPAPQKAPARPLADASTPAPPSWMKNAGARVLPGKRGLYGVVAGTFALIGIAALVVQFATRSGGRVPASTTPTAAQRVPATAGPTTPTSPATTGTATATTTATAPATVTAIPTPTANHPTTKPTTTATPTPPAVTATHPTARPATASVTTAAPPAAPAAARTLPPVATAPAPLVATSAEERQARCTEILQKASLEKITAAETDFFKRECK
jgi:hypothetical protein